METDRIELLEGLARLAYCHLDPLLEMPPSVNGGDLHGWENETIQEYDTSTHTHAH